MLSSPRKGVKRGHEKSAAHQKTDVDVKKVNVIPRCDSLTEEERKSLASPTVVKKQKKSHDEPCWSPIQPLKTSAPVKEYPSLNGKDDFANTSSNIYELTFANKSWADIVFEEEEEMKKHEEMKKMKKKEKFKFKENEELTKLVSESLLSNGSRKKKDENENVWKDRLRSPSKKVSSSSENHQSPRCSKTLTPNNKNRTPNKSEKVGRTPEKRRSPEKRRTPKRLHDSDAGGYRFVSPSKNWRTRRALDEDSQDTLTESSRIKKTPIRRAVSANNEDDSTQFGQMLNQQRRRDSEPRLQCIPERDWGTPKQGWENDPEVLRRRDKDINKGKNSEIYRQYIAAIPRSERSSNKDVHPRTPNKYLKMPRRSWDMQIRVWRRMLYFAMDADVPFNSAGDCSFLSSSSCSSASTDVSGEDVDVSILNVTDEDLSSEIANLDEGTITDTITDGSGPTNFASLALATV